MEDIVENVTFIQQEQPVQEPLLAPLTIFANV